MLSWPSYVVIALILATIGLAWSRKFPAVGALAIGNVAIHGFNVLGPRVVRITEFGIYSAPVAQAELAFRPDDVYGLHPIAFLRVFTSMFLHADLGHLTGNLIVLLAFALVFEELIGARRFMVTYLATGVLAVVAHLGATWGSSVGLVGASGAVAGIVGAFAGTYPHMVMRLPIPIFFIVFVRMKVMTAALVFLLIQLVFQFLSRTSEALSGVAYAAHIGGVAAGLGVATVWLRKVRRPDADEPVTLDFDGLERFATDKSTQRAFQEMKDNREFPDVFAAWFDKFWQGARDPDTGMRVQPGPRGKVVREDGHEFDLRIR